MAFHRAFIYLSVFFLYSNVWLVNAAKHVLHSSHKHHFLRGLEANVTTNVSLWAPYYRNRSGGGAWIIPTNAHDLGPRAVECQCLNPDETCCLAKSNHVAPFCIPQNSTCCSDTFCDPGEMCCGDSCCPSETICAVNHFGAGCCPKNQLCSGPAICYDYISPNCTSTFFRLPQCCPPNVPFCRDFSLIGIGCFPRSAVPVVTTTMGEPFSAFSASSRSKSQPMPEIIVTVTETVTLQQEIGLDFSSLILVPPISLLADESTMTAPASSISSASSTTSGTSSLAPESTTTKTANISIISATTTRAPALCFNPELQAPGPCPSDDNPFDPRPAVSTFNPSGQSPETPSAVTTCLGVSVLFTLSLLFSSLTCCLPRKKTNNDEMKTRGGKTLCQHTSSVLPEEQLEARVPQEKGL